MKLGYRIFNIGEIVESDLPLVQISVWHKDGEDIKRVSQMAGALKNRGLDFVIHVASLYMSETRPGIRDYHLQSLKEYAKMADLALVVHDETGPDGNRLNGIWREAYEEALAELEKICRVSIENAFDSKNALWFWDQFADSITFDIGHFEAAGMDVLGVIEDLEDGHIKKLDFVHIHRNDGVHWGSITDHWPLTMGCVEIGALERLLELKEDVGVIIEVDVKDLPQSLQALSSTIH